MKRNIAICLVVGLLLAVGFQITLYQNIERKTGHDDTLFSTSKLDEEADTLHRSDNDDSGMFWVIIRATNIPNSASFKINDCNITQLSNNEWALWCTLGGNYEKNRAKVYKTLFYGTDGSNPRFTAAYITNCQAIKTAHLDDVDKRGHYAYLEAAHVSKNEGIYYSGTFQFGAPATNRNCSSWSYIDLYDGDAYNGWEIPTGDSPPNRRNYAQYHPGNRLSDETESDTSGDTIFNPPNCQLDCHKVDDNLGLGKVRMRVFLVANATITWTKNIVGNVGTESTGSTDFTNNGMPKFSDGTLYSLGDPIIKRPNPSGIFNESRGIYYNNTRTVTWRWGPPEHKVRDIVGYYVKITNQAGFTVVDDEYTTNENFD